MSRIIHPKPITAYQFAELSDKAKQYACDKYNADGAELFTDCYVDILESFGFSNVKIWYSLAYCQSDFASFDAQWKYKKGWKKAHIAEYVKCKYTEHFDTIAKIARMYFYDFELTVSTTNSNYPKLDYNFMCNVYNDQYQYMDTEYSRRIQLAIHNIAKQIYSDLLADYEYTTSLEAFAETCECNDYEFTENGVML